MLKFYEHSPLLAEGSIHIVLDSMLGRGLLSSTSASSLREQLLEQKLIGKPAPDWPAVLTDLGKEEVKKLSFREIGNELFGGNIPGGFYFFIEAEEDRNRPEKFDSNNIQSVEKAIEYYGSCPESRYFRMMLGRFKKKLAFLTQLQANISTLRELSTRRPLLAREQVELSFLEKIQVADDFYALDAINNELTNTATDPELKARLQKYVVDKMDFY